LETFYEAQPGLLKESAIALGFFDGVHPGHQVVIGKAVEEAKRLGVKPGVVTFRDHPRTLTRGASPLLLTVIEQRLELFAALGVEAALVLSFTEDLCKLSPKEYVEEILAGAMGARSISVGFNHHFGRDREGDPDLLRKLGERLGFCVHVSEMVYVDGREVSSSQIREQILAGELELAAELLSRPYAVPGVVVHGEGRGRKIGFPTANLGPSDVQLIPRRGVYAGVTHLAGGRALKSVINVGYRPTFTGITTSNAPAQVATSPAPQTNGGCVVVKPAPQPLVEVHILDFDEDLYGQRITVDFLKYLRSEKKFDGVEALKRQIAQDSDDARAYTSQSISCTSYS